MELAITSGEKHEQTKERVVRKNVCLPDPNPLPSDWHTLGVHQKLERRRIAFGLCRGCGKEPLVANKTYGQRCLDKKNGEYAGLLAKGLCPGCRQPYTGPHTNCDGCRSFNNSKANGQNEKRVREKRCSQCGGARDLPLGRTCLACREKNEERRTSLRAQREAAGLCMDCDRLRVGTRSPFCRYHLFYYAAVNHYADVRAASALEALWDGQSGACALCGDQMELGTNAQCGHDESRAKNPESLPRWWVHDYCNVSQNDKTRRDYCLHIIKVLTKALVDGVISPAECGAITLVLNSKNP